MGFFNRLGDSLFSPSQVLQYRVDKKIVTFFYFMFLCVLLMIPSFISLCGNNRLFTYETKTNIRMDCFNKDEIPYIIENGKLTFAGTNEKNAYFINLDSFELTLLFTTQEKVVVSEEMYRTIVLFDQTSIFIKTTVGRIEIAKYIDYDDMEGLDLKNLTQNNSVFWDQVTKCLTQVENNYRGVIISSMIAMIVIRSVGTLLLFILFITIINRISALNIYSFGNHFKLMVYYVTPFVVGTVFAKLFQIVLIEYIGLIVTFIYSLKINKISIGGGSNQNDNEL